MTTRIGAIAVIASIYALLFFQADYVGTKGDPNILSPTMPETAQAAAMGYLHQIDAERLYIKAMTFLAGASKEEVPPPYANTFTEYFEIMNQLHPYLFDVYWASAAFLPWYGEEYTIRTNAILERGLTFRPEEWELPFRLGFNYFYHLHDSKSAYKYLLLASDISKNNFMRHLASVLAAREGDLRAGLVWMKVMRDKETDPSKLDRLNREVDAYEKAVYVQDKVNQFYHENRVYPESLNSLIPGYLISLPKIKADFEVVYQDGIVKLERPGYVDRHPKAKRGETSHSE